jgi:hypothetical protein
MCRECNWTEEGRGYKILQRCDCGHGQWVKAYRDTSASGEPVEAPALFRCAKCDQLQLALRLH